MFFISHFAPQQIRFKGFFAKCLAVIAVIHTYQRKIIHGSDIAIARDISQHHPAICFSSHLLYKRRDRDAMLTFTIRQMAINDGPWLIRKVCPQLLAIEQKQAFRFIACIISLREFKMRLMPHKRHTSLALF